jgi:hypothetical protein
MELSDRLPPGAQPALWAPAALAPVLIGAAERDIQRRPAAKVWDPELLWRVMASIRTASFRGRSRRLGRRAAAFDDAASTWVQAGQRRACTYLRVRRSGDGFSAWNTNRPFSRPKRTC